jgi:NAD(P)-dependent dehydrogenase (short-subunit alcohol dehydrogenase family)
MALYRASPKDGVAWITGGSSGIGRALARELAAEGFTVAVTAREEDPIDSLIEETKNLPGRILSYPCDVCDEQGMAATVDAIEASGEPIVLAVFNAGAYVPVSGENLSVRKFGRSFDVNVMGVVHGLVPVAGRMRQRGKGQVVMIGSISAYFGWPTTAAYGATKAALNAMAQSLRFDFDRVNIRLQVVNPGFIDTPLTQRTNFKLPALMSAGDAAHRIRKGIASGGFEIAFPGRLVYGLKGLALLPSSLRHWLITTFTGWKTRPSLPRTRRPRS